MAEKPKVHDLPVESSKHGLSTTGPKYTLDKRLKSHLNEENISSLDASVGEQRQRDSRFNDPNESEKIRAVEVLQQMDSLQRQAFLKGISGNWLKKELLTDSWKNLKSCSESEDKGEKDVDIKGKKQVITNTEYSEVLDQYLPDHIKAEYHVLEHVQDMPNSVTKIQLSKLDPRIANFISLIRNNNMMKQQIMGLGYDATSLTKDIYAKEDPLYSWYQCLQCELEPIEAESKEYSMIKTYLQNTDTEVSYKLNNIFRASRQGESERFEKFSGTKNRMLLWHGSRLTNWAGILSQGLRIAPPEAPVSGCDFGKGVYFSDMFSRSVGYCVANSKSPDAVLLLCEVALGDMNELLTLDCNADKLPKGKLSTKGVGKIAPDLSEAQVLEDGVIVPLGLPKEQSYPMVACRHNEYIVYNVEQIRMRYVVHAKFCYTHEG
ncbi:poly [ADP-ribose] polymerase 2-like [Pistacia vera]|uniref:poly [ADP-ribose] polymerase 2-like n=1 Tax=Pistacia vera TaxID=55513 RepID=UPI001263D271|nr:poly [ADP-ribose] polymerase 2-like [Pistacia vera]